MNTSQCDHSDNLNEDFSLHDAIGAHYVSV